VIVGEVASSSVVHHVSNGCFYTLSSLSRWDLRARGVARCLNLNENLNEFSAEQQPKIQRTLNSYPVACFYRHTRRGGMDSLLHELCLAAERDEAAERAENEKKAQGKKIPQASRAGPTAPSSGVGASSSGVDAQVQIPEHEHDFQRVVAETLGNRMAIDGKPKTNRNAWVTRRKIEGLTMLHLAKYLAFYATERNTAITTKIETPDGIIPYYIGRRLLDCYDARTLPDDAMYFMRRSPPWREVIARRKKNLPKKGLKDIDFARWVLTSCHLAPSPPRRLAPSLPRRLTRSLVLQDVPRKRHPEEGICGPQAAYQAGHRPVQPGPSPREDLRGRHDRQEVEGVHG